MPARGVERWLTQRLSHRLGSGPRGGDGVCAGVRFLSPHSLVALLLGKERDDPWDPDRLVWPLLEVIDASLDEPWCATLAAHLGHGADGEDGELRRSRRYSVARRLAGLFAGYAVQRPALVTDWREGRDTDGAGRRLDHDLAWQPELWRRVLHVVDAAPPDVRHHETLTRLASGGDGLDLPSRLSLFGHTRLPVTEVELLRALGALRDVHLWLPQVSAPLWDALDGLTEQGAVPRAEDTSIRAVGHPLLGSLGRDARELQRTLGEVPSREVSATGGDGDGPAGLLGWLQADLRGNAEPDAATRRTRPLAADDRSVQVHACHGASRQVDVLREVLVGLLEDDPTLEPRDILVMCPDIETFAPLIEAGFGLADLPGARDGHPGHRLRVRLADRALSSTNPLLALASRLAELAGSRMTATEVLDLAGAEPVRRRFGFTDDDLAQLALWAEQSGVRWGLDGAHRSPYGLSLRENTWDLALSRVLLGVTMSGDEHRHVAEALPVDDVSSNDVDLVGRFTEYVDRLRRFVDAAGDATTITQWTDVLSQGVGELASVPQRDAWQSAQFDRLLAATRDSAGDGDDGARGTGTPLLLADVRHLLEHRLGGRPTRSNFRTGTLTVCTMVPMRSVPHRVVCLLGLDDGVFPRAGSVDGDDVLARDPMTGERDVRSEDRQLFLDAILAARRTLVITYTGANEHTGSVRPPAVPLGELLDALDVTTAGDADAVREQVLVHHPLQPFDPRNLLPGALGGHEPFSFDRSALAGATAARGARTPATTLLVEPLPPRPGSDVALADLHAFLAHPVRAFLRSRLDLTAPLEAEETHDAIPLTLDGLEKWAIGDRMLAEVLAGTNPPDVVRAEQLRGQPAARTARRPRAADHQGPAQRPDRADRPAARRGAAVLRRGRRPRRRAPADRLGRTRVGQQARDGVLLTARGQAPAAVVARPARPQRRPPRPELDRPRGRPQRPGRRPRAGGAARPPGGAVAARGAGPLRPRHARAVADAAQDRLCLRRGGAASAARRRPSTRWPRRAGSGRPTGSPPPASPARTPTPPTSRRGASTRRSSACCRRLTTTSSGTPSRTAWAGSRCGCGARCSAGRSG